MLTFEQALLMLKTGEDMRHESWPAGRFVRLVMPGQTTPVGYQLQQYQPTQAEMLGQQWSKA